MEATAVAAMSSQLDLILGTARATFASGVTKSPLYRKEQLKALYRMLVENESFFVEALRCDLRKSRFESIMTEVDYVLNDIRSALNNLDSWMKPKFVSKCFVTLVDDNYIYYEPYGLVLILSAWNYPIQLAFSPMVGAIAAGNVCILKPSEVAPATANLIADLMPKYLDRKAYYCILGDGICAQTLVGSPLIDYVFFTGSNQIGKLIYETAAKNLTPVSLEMGGKSPVYIDELTFYGSSLPSGKLNSKLFETTVRRILWGKFLNTGQTCVAPDYVLCTKQIAAEFMKLAAIIIKQFYGEAPIDNPDYGRIVNSRHYARLVDMLSAQRQLNASQRLPLLGGNFQIDKMGNPFVEPTVLICSSNQDPIMQGEIFGPILPLVLINDAQEAIDFINSRDKPLALYIFSQRDLLIKQFRNETSSGSICVNDTVLHLVAEALPFGGVGKSGIGAYHGKHSFKTFSHQKSMLVRGFNPIIEWVAKKRYPPYSDNHLKRMLRLLKRRKNPIPWLTSKDLYAMLFFFLGFILCFLYTTIPVREIIKF